MNLSRCDILNLVKALRIVVRLIMLLGTLAVALGAIWLGLFFSSSIGLFGIRQSMQERIEGFILLGVGILLVFFSFSVFRKKILIPVIILLSTVALGMVVLSIYNQGAISQDILIVTVPYTIGILVCYFLDDLIGKKIPNETSIEDKAKDQKINKLLIGIPVVLLVLGWWYRTYGFYWREQSSNAENQKTVSVELGYQMYTAKYLPAGYKLRETRLGGIHEDYFYAEYRNSNQDYFILAQHKKPDNLYLQPPRCSIYGGTNDSFEIQSNSGSASGINSNCELVTTPKGQDIYLMSITIFRKENFAAMVIGDTLITATGYKYSHQELIKMFDSLEAKSPPIKAPNMKDYE